MLPRMRLWMTSLDDGARDDGIRKRLRKKILYRKALLVLTGS